MSTILKVLITLSCLGFVIALLEVLFGTYLLGVAPEAYSRACSNLALIAIALAVCFKSESKEED